MHEVLIIEKLLKKTYTRKSQEECYLINRNESKRGEDLIAKKLQTPIEEEHWTENKLLNSFEMKSSKWFAKVQ